MAKESYESIKKAVFSRRGLIKEVCDHVAQGGSLIEFASANRIKYCDLVSWINADNERNRRMNEAAIASAEWVRVRILDELKAIGLVDIRRLYKNGRLLPAELWPDDVAKAIASVDTEESFDGGGLTKKIKLLDKIKALNLIGTQYGLFIQRHAVVVGKKLEDILAESWDDEPAE